jgi:hypothetical protein
VPPDEGDVGLQPGDKQEEHDPDQADDLQQVALDGRLGHDPLAHGWHQAAQEGRAEQDARQNFAEDGRLPKA